MDDLERMVLDAVSSLAMHLDDFDFTRWKQEWDSAYETPPVGAQPSNVPSEESGLGELLNSKITPTAFWGGGLGPESMSPFIVTAGGAFNATRTPPQKSRDASGESKAVSYC